MYFSAFGGAFPSPAFGILILRNVAETTASNRSRPLADDEIPSWVHEGYLIAVKPSDS